MKISFNMPRMGNGTREWSDFSYNICNGCSHGCLYCYAKSFRARFDEDVWIPGNWERQQLRPQAKLGADLKGQGVVMFPTTHDVTPEFLPEAATTIRNLLNGGNQVLIVSKPHLSVVRHLCQEFGSQKSRILFRFTIGALDDELLGFWEPGAPTASERLASLHHAHAAGFATSVSVEPMVDAVDATVGLVNTVSPLVSDTIWIGKMQRVPIKLNAHVPGFTEAREIIRLQQSDSEILRLVQLLQGRTKVRWKDSIKAVIDKASTTNK